MTAATPLVSVVMPFLDGIHFLPEAIDSVVTQTYPEWELLLVDDGSTDGSSALARDYARGRPDRIRYLEHAGHANRGKSTSRNLGIAQARGELLAFLDKMPGKIDEYEKMLTKNQIWIKRTKQIGYLSKENLVAKLKLVGIDVALP